MQLFGELPDSHAITCRETLNGQQSLILTRGQSGGFGSGLTKV